MFGRRTPDLLEHSQDSRHRSIYDAVDELTTALDTREYIVHDTTVSGNTYLISVGAHDAIHYRAPSIVTRLLHTYGNKYFTMILIDGTDQDRDKRSMRFSSVGDYNEWSGSRTERYFDTLSWQVTMSRN